MSSSKAAPDSRPPARAAAAHGRQRGTHAVPARAGATSPRLPPALAALVQRLVPHATILDVEPLGSDVATAAATHKGGGYGVPLRITLQPPKGELRRIVFHTETPSEFGHDRRSDRASDMLLAFDTFNQIPGHVAALDVGAIRRDGELVSLRTTGEFYVVTDWAEGTLYADDLRRIAAARTSGPLDLARAVALADKLAEIHMPVGSRPAVYRRSVRDLVGHGEGIFGIVDGYPDDVPGAPGARLQEIERRAATWRWKLRDKAERLRRIHGDFHPFNLLFDAASRLSLLDASRGCLGDPADDVCALAMNYLFFALETPGSWTHGFRPLWNGFWQRVLETHDRELLAVVPPYLAWRLLVVANPRWYPAVEPAVRDALLGFAERALAAERLDPLWAEELCA